MTSTHPLHLQSLHNMTLIRALGEGPGFSVFFSTCFSAAGPARLPPRPAPPGSPPQHAGEVRVVEGDHLRAVKFFHFVPAKSSKANPASGPFMSQRSLYHGVKELLELRRRPWPSPSLPCCPTNS